MTNPEWHKASTDKKLEMLRDDIRRLFDISNVLIRNTERISGFVERNETMLKEVAKAVETLESQTGEKPAKKK